MAKVSCGVSVVFLLSLAGSATAQQPAEDHVSGRLLVGPLEKTSEAVIQRSLVVSGARLHHKIEGINVLALEAPEAALNAVTAALLKTGAFAFVERDHLAHGAAEPNDAASTSQWH